MVARFGFKSALLAVAVSGLCFSRTILAGPQLDGTFAQEYAPTVPVTELLANEAAAVQQPLTNDAATESQGQLKVKVNALNPTQAALLCVAALLLSALLAPRVARLLSFDPWAETRAQERVAEQKAFTDFVAAFKVGPGASTATTASGPSSEAPKRTWHLSDVDTAADGAGTLQVGQRVPAPLPAPVVDENEKAARRLSFAAGASNQLSGMVRLLRGIATCSDTEGRRELLMELCSRLGAFKDLANFPEMMPAWQMAAALEGLMKQLAGRPGRATASSLHTAAAGLDLLKDLCVPGISPGLTTNPPPRFLAADDDTICRHAVATALKKVFTDPELAVDGHTALALAEREKFDVIFLDIEMPGIDGFELCRKIRTTANNQKTPVVFVTSHSDFDSRLKFTLTGAQDLIAKPFLSFEIALKALTLLLQGRLNAERPPAAVRPAAALCSMSAVVPQIQCSD